MKLNLLERFTLLQILPTEGNFTTLNIVRDLQKVLALSEEEFKEFGVVQEGDKTTWNKKGREDREIKIGEKATDIIVESLKKLDESKKLTSQHMTIYEKFIGG